jgi:dihydroflavonol-4-reductase
MKPLYLLTGATGYLGGHVAARLIRLKYDVRALVLPGDKGIERLPRDVATVEGDISKKEDVERFFSGTDGRDVYVIHMASIVTINWAFDRRVYDINVGGTKNMVDASIAHQVKKLVYVSSVHAIPEKPHDETITEVNRFEPAHVIGVYGKTKAEASQAVLDAVHNYGLDASIVHPAGLIGPGDFESGYLTTLLKNTAEEKLFAGVKGGYNFVDVRDVADGVVAAASLGRKGECYILGNRQVEVREILDDVSDLTGAKSVKRTVPLWIARLAVPFFALIAKIRGQKPLFTLLSLHTLNSNANFSIEKATRELGYKVRSFATTIRDALIWMDDNRRLELSPEGRRRLRSMKKQPPAGRHFVRKADDPSAG